MKSIDICLTNIQSTIFHFTYDLKKKNFTMKSIDRPFKTFKTRDFPMAHGVNPTGNTRLSGRDGLGQGVACGLHDHLRGRSRFKVYNSNIFINGYYMVIIWLMMVNDG